jgi:long-chain acyl-CoA synthetase
MTTYDQKPWLAQYEEGVPATIEYDGRLFHQVLEDSARKYPDHVAVRMILRYLPLGLAIQSKMNYRAFDESANRFAAALHRLGLKPGARVAIMLPNLPQQMVAFYGILKAGCVVVSTNPTYTSRELNHQLQDSGAEAIVMLSGLYERLARIRTETEIRHVIIADVPDTLGFPFNRLVERQVRTSGLMADVPSAPDVHRFDDLLRANPANPPQISTQADDPALLQYTGGTTGTPRAAILTHANLVTNVLQISAWLTDLELGGERLLGALPFFHIYGLTVGMSLAVYSGGQAILLPDPRNTDLVLEVIHRERISLYPGVPAMYIAIINHPRVQQFDLRSVKACLSGGASLPMEVQQRFGEITGGRLVEGYGLTESSPVSHANPIYGQKKKGSAGIAIPGTEAAVIALDPDPQGEFPLVPIGEEGELIIRGPQVMAGYWHRPEETAAALDEEGWLRTGDIVKMDEDGFIYVVDRKKDLIIASGYNIVPREVEEVLFMHEKVQEAVVVGVPDPKRGETVKAYIVLKEGQAASVDEIVAFCRENLAPFKVPRLVEFRSELPKSQIGKYLRRVLVEEEQQKLAGQS